MDYIMERYVRANDKGQVEYFFVEAALLIEAGYKQVVDELWYIHADRKVREERLRSSRGYSDQRIADIMSKQLTEEEFFKECDFVIDNSGELEETFRQIDDLLNYL
jgi:dephospho-CoA kinase